MLEYLGEIFTLNNMLWLVIGSVVGAVLGAIPGMSADTGIAIFLPLTFNMPPLTGLITLAAIYVTGSYGGNITAVLINTPGTSDSYFMTMDGYPLTRKGLPHRALAITTFGAFVGGVIGGFALLFIAPPLAQLAVSFGPLELFLTTLMGIVIIVGMSKGTMVKGLISACMGFLFSLIGLDGLTGLSRFSMGINQIYDELPLLGVVLGLFAVSQLFTLVEEYDAIPMRIEADVKLSPAREVFKIMRQLKLWVANVVSGVIGTLVGIIPAAGTTVAAGISYNLFKGLDKHPEEYGDGSETGLSVVSSANNAVVGGSLVPLMTLGIPGNGTSALFLGGLLVHGMRPGIQLFTHSAGVTYGMIWGLIMANFMILLIGLFGTQLYVKITAVENSVLVPVVASLCVLGAYSFRSMIFDMGLIVLFGLLGWLMVKTEIPLAPFVLAFVLGRTAEIQFRRAILLYGNSVFGMLLKPIPFILLLTNIIMFLAPFLPGLIAKFRTKKTN